MNNKCRNTMHPECIVKVLRPLVSPRVKVEKTIFEILALFLIFDADQARGVKMINITTRINVWRAYSFATSRLRISLASICHLESKYSILQTSITPAALQSTKQIQPKLKIILSNNWHCRFRRTKTNCNNSPEWPKWCSKWASLLSLMTNTDHNRVLIMLSYTQNWSYW